MEIKMLACGCNGMATHGQDHDGLGGRHPSCITHGSCEVVETPDFTNRIARCTYFRKSYTENGRYRNECGECKTGICTHEKTSNNNLAFFQHHPGKEFDEFYCGCYLGWD